MGCTLRGRTRFVVLVAEDDEDVRDLAAEILGGEGWVVLAAKHAAGALELLERHFAEVDLLFTDINMPGKMDGLALAHHVHVHWPEIRLLVTSGKLTEDPLDLPPDSRFLPKPYKPAHVVGQIRELAAC